MVIERNYTLSRITYVRGSFLDRKVNQTIGIKVIVNEVVNSDLKLPLIDNKKPVFESEPISEVEVLLN